VITAGRLAARCLDRGCLPQSAEEVVRSSWAGHRTEVDAETGAAIRAVIVVVTRLPGVATEEADTSALQAISARAARGAIEIAPAGTGAMNAFTRVAGSAADAAVGAVGLQVDADPIADRFPGRAGTETVLAGLARAGRAVDIDAALCLENARLTALLLAALALLLPFSFPGVGIAVRDENRRQARQTDAGEHTEQHAAWNLADDASHQDVTQLARVCTEFTPGTVQSRALH
jgi:hypothetical protein